MPGHADYTASTRQHEPDHTDHTDHTDQRAICLTGRSRSSGGDRDAGNNCRESVTRCGDGRERALKLDGSRSSAARRSSSYGRGSDGQGGTICDLRVALETFLFSLFHRWHHAVTITYFLGSGGRSRGEGGRSRVSRYHRYPSYRGVAQVRFLLILALSTPGHGGGGRLRSRGGFHTAAATWFDLRPHVGVTTKVVLKI